MPAGSAVSMLAAGEETPHTLGALQQQAVPWRGWAGAGETTWEQADMAGAGWKMEWVGIGTMMQQHGYI